ncbi:MAG TPA: non-canonical purine NTP pyrophosphatase, RdgB/HAM1 family [Elusimicrobia bacterium]|nr:MAG: non-canonical purine NTP pyrophosphatase, RdgB/HAM1 family [Elusimicrobia bacterium GWF2_62_30]HBA61386.1 non-canonical purine NTP pyrophosphatase, RdgB/HAM1 family [Elusimicrobiota bacterium]
MKSPAVEGKTVKTLIIATFNPHKVVEIKELLPGLSLELKCLAELPGAVPAPENGDTFEANAVEKASAAAAFSGCWALADDSGLEVDALGGAPGVRSARYAGEGRSAADNNARLLEELSAVPDGARAARFVCAVALVSPGGGAVVKRGTLEGVITRAPRGAGGFGYDPLFEAQKTGLTLAELSSSEKNLLSHRGAALRALLPELEALAGASR